MISEVDVISDEKKRLVLENIEIPVNYKIKEMSSYLNVTIKIDISLCEMTFGFIYIYIYIY